MNLNPKTHVSRTKNIIFFLRNRLLDKIHFIENKPMRMYPRPDKKNNKRNINNDIHLYFIRLVNETKYLNTYWSKHKLPREKELEEMQRMVTIANKRGRDSVEELLDTRGDLDHANRCLNNAYGSIKIKEV